MTLHQVKSKLTPASDLVVTTWTYEFCNRSKDTSENGRTSKGRDTQGMNRKFPIE